MAVRYLTEKEKEMILIGLNMRRNVIETNCYSLGANDLKNMDPEGAKRQFDAEINALSDDQMVLILAMSKLEQDIRSDKLFVDE